MINIGDTVKVISKTLYNGVETELIPIGTICTVKSTYEDLDTGLINIEIAPLCSSYSFYYLECEVERGHITWVKY